MSIIDEFEETVDHIYGVYLDSTAGFHRLREWFIETQKTSLIQMNGFGKDKKDIRHLDSLAMIYGDGSPNDPKSVVLHKCTQKEYKERNDKEGVNYKFIGNMALVSIYQYWEDHYRKDIASYFGVKKEELKSPIFGDLRLLRISIVHHNGIALKEVEKCEKLKFYVENDKIFIDKERFQIIILNIKQQITEWKVRDGEV